MNPFTVDACNQLKRSVTEGVDLVHALTSVGGRSLADGVWRLFSHTFPAGGTENWNHSSSWRSEWGAAAATFIAFGEDVFGNQLAIRPNEGNAFLWNHENGECCDLLLDPVTLLEAVLQGGLEWIDFYANGSLAVAQSRMLDVPLECHLHWTTPLILGGTITIANTTVVERNLHLIGHAKLWRQIAELPPGATVIKTKKRI